MKQRRPDRLTNPDAVGSIRDEAIYAACRSTDTVAVAMEQKWGFDRLPTLVEADLAAKFGRAKAQLDAAIDDGDAEMVAQKAKAMARGWRALDAAADAAGADVVVDVALGWLRRHPETGVGYVITKDNATAGALRANGVGGRIYTMAEVCRIIEALEEKSNGVVPEAKDIWEAEVINVRNGDDTLDDKIPF